MTTRAGLTVAALLAAAACVATYWPGIGGVFYFDSAERIVRNDALAMTQLDTAGLVRAAYAGGQAYPERALSNISFALNHLASGGRFVPAAFKLGNLVIHLLNALLVLWLLRRTLAISPRRWASGESATAWLAALAAGLWLVHPIQLTSVLYAVQRMTSLSAACVLLGLALFVLGRQRLAQGDAQRSAQRIALGLVLMVAGVAFGAGVGFFAKQNALLMPLFAALLEWFFFDRTRLTPGTRRTLQCFYLVTVAVPLLTALALLVLHPEPLLEGYRARDFGLAERLLTQSRVLVLYLGLLLIPLPGAFGLYHDDVSISTGLLSPPTTAACLVLWCVVALALVKGWRDRSPWAFALSWFLVGHALESSVLPLEMAHEHRNYLPSLGILAGVAWAAHGTATRARLPAAAKATGAALLLGALAIVTGDRAAHWQHPQRLMQRLVHDHPNSYRALTGAIANIALLSREERIALLTRAALAQADGVYPLIQLGRELALSSPQVDDTLAEAIAIITGRAPSTDRDVLQTALVGDFTARLRRHAVSTDSVVSLVALTDCVIARQRECVAWQAALAPALGAVIEQQRTTDINMTVLHLSMAKLRAVAGDVDGALAEAAAIERWTPDSATYRLLQVELHARLGRRREARELLDGIARRLGARVRNDPRFERLRELSAN